MSADARVRIRCSRCWRSPLPRRLLCWHSPRVGTALASGFGGPGGLSGRAPRRPRARTTAPSRFLGASSRRRSSASGSASCHPAGGRGRCGPWPTPSSPARRRCRRSSSWRSPFRPSASAPRRRCWRSSIYCLMPILRGTAAALDAARGDVAEAARAMGLTPVPDPAQVEIPLALPVIAEALRVALILAVATAAVGALAGASTLGTPDHHRPAEPERGLHPAGRRRDGGARLPGRRPAPPRARRALRAPPARPRRRPLRRCPYRPGIILPEHRPACP